VYARTTTIEAMPSSVDAGIAYVRDKVMSTLEGLEGHVGLSLLADRASGRCITTSAWESEEAMRASEQAVQEIRSRAAEIFGGGSPTVDEWEIAVLHRDHGAGEGACVRVTWVKVDPDRVDPGIDMFKTTVLPALDELEGLCSASLLVDRASGRAVTSAAWDSADAMERNRTQLDELRASASKDANAEVLDERDFELVIARLRVPELA
jgi:heme-degrading monooxygenase HmoA